MNELCDRKMTSKSHLKKSFVIGTICVVVLLIIFDITIIALLLSQHCECNEHNMTVPGTYSTPIDTTTLASFSLSSVIFPNSASSTKITTNNPETTSLKTARSTSTEGVPNSSEPTTTVDPETTTKSHPETTSFKTPDLTPNQAEVILTVDPEITSSETSPQSSPASPETSIKTDPQPTETLTVTPKTTEKDTTLNSSPTPSTIEIPSTTDHTSTKPKFSILNKKVNWNDAKKECENEGMRLAHITSNEDNEDVKALIKSEGCDTGEDFWIAATKLGDPDGNFQWMDSDKDIEYADWGMNQPDNSFGDENCVGLYSEDHLKWHDFECSEESGAICETIS